MTNEAQQNEAEKGVFGYIKENVNLLVGGLVIGGVLGLGIGGYIGTTVKDTNIRQNYNLIKIIDEGRVQEGYANPSKLEVKLKDLDNSGQEETIISYNGGKKHLLTVEDGDLSISRYELIPAQIVPSEIQEPYANPGEVERIIGDVTGDGKTESLLRYRGEYYPLTVDDDKKLSITDYEFSPGQPAQEATRPTIVRREETPVEEIPENNK